jgi:hypothetical protein
MTARELPYMRHKRHNRARQFNLHEYVLRTRSLLDLLDTLESMATLMTLLSAFLADDKSFHVPVSIRGVGYGKGAHPKKLHISLGLNVRGSFS